MTPQERLEQAIRQREDDTRPHRIERTLWLSNHLPAPAVIMGRAEPLHLLEEAKSVFIYGQYAAALILSLAVIEHCLVEELHDRGLLRKSPGLTKTVGMAGSAGVMPIEWMAPIELLAKRRNSLVHFKDEDDEHGISNRIRTEKAHPRVIMEGDAKEALAWMFKVFNATLHEAA